MDSDLEWLSLAMVSGLGVSGAWRLLEHFKTPTALLNARCEDLHQCPSIRKNQLAGLVSGEDWRGKAREELARLKAIGAQVVAYDSPLYPPLLKELYDPPLVLFVLGKIEALKHPAVAVVGSRAATAYGRRTAFRLAQDLVRHNRVVVSGLALGIDTEAHKGALAGSGRTLAVLGCGLDIVYPRQNKELFRSILRNGAVMTEYCLGTLPEHFRFPARNRIIAGISSGVVVVEAARKSGSLITAQLALDAGRDIFAIPGQIDSYKSEGAHWLLQQGAKLVTNVFDILEETVHSAEYSSVAVDDSDSPDIEPDALSLLKQIEPYPQTREELFSRLNMSSSRVSELLLLLELEGYIEILPGDRLTRIRP
ncbi:MAG: DNA-protecting protein DprA [Deltaproteobacteria bacterium]|nr:MAG: DNA-protecting protein DprA [Deltaproteobacteria bacterium]